MDPVIYPSWTVGVIRRKGPASQTPKLVEIIIDQVAIDRVLDGEAPREILNSTEKREAFRQAYEIYPSRPIAHVTGSDDYPVPVRQGFGPDRAMTPWEFARYLGLSPMSCRQALAERPLDVDYRNSPIPYVLAASVAA